MVVAVVAVVVAVAVEATLLWKKTALLNFSAYCLLLLLLLR